MRTLITIFFCFAFVQGPSAVRAAERKPNIVFMLADDLGWGDVGCNGRTEWPTPNIDQLAREGTNFKRWYVAAVVCAPSRAALMTGKYTIHNGVTANNDDLPPNEITVAAALKQRGYATALFGKWHHGKPRPGERDFRHPLDLGFDDFFGFTDARHAWEHFPKELWFGREKKPVSGYADTLFVDRGIEFMQQNKDRPFFLYLAFNAPHLLIEAPEDDVALFKGKFPEKDPTKPLRATYAAMVHRTDKEVGRVAKALNDLGLANDTLVIFSSDHGATFEAGNQGTSAYHDSNRPFRGHKRTLWEGGIRVPGIVRWPGQVPAGKESHDLVHNIDVLPTLLALAGAQPDPAWKVDGRDLLPMWTGKANLPSPALYWEWRSEGCNQLAAMRRDFKLVITGNTRPELFNVETDPGERRSIVAEHPALAKELEDGLTTWLATETDAAKDGKKRP